MNNNNIMNISFLTDNPNSWIISYLENFKKSLNNFNIRHYYSQEEIKDSGEILFILSCEKIVRKEALKYHKKNIVVHPSKLPKGKGWSPVAWQILEGVNSIPVSLFEANSKVDSGQIYFQDEFKLYGHELNEEIKYLQGKSTFKLIKKFLKSYPNLEPFSQKGESTYYKKRTKNDSELDINRSIKDQFNLLRIVDNNLYPAFFFHHGHKYTIKITKNE